ncbi:MAG: hypothetical protein ABI430_03340 [Candidatus Taylorbacteria bacterium]
MENKDPNNQYLSEAQKIASIRTLESDIARAKEEKDAGGEITDLQPNTEIPVPPPTPLPQIPQKKELPPEPPQDNPFVRSDLLPFKDGEAPENPKKLQFEVSPLRTYTNDVAQAVQSGNTSLIQIAVAEQKEKEQDRIVEKAGKSRTHKNVFLIVASLIMLSLGAGILYYGIFLKKPDEPIVSPVKIELINSESQKEITFNGDREKLLLDLEKEMSAVLATSSVRILKVIDSTTAKMIPAPQFLSLIAPNVPSYLARSLNPEFALGIYFNQKSRPFLIFKIDSYENTFGGMLKWEENISGDLGRLFLTLDNQNQSNLEVGLAGSVFKDSVIKNQDIRFMTGKNGDVILLYAFINKDLLIITTDPTVLTELTDRIRRAQILR